MLMDSTFASKLNLILPSGNQTYVMTVLTQVWQQERLGRSYHVNMIAVKQAMEYEEIS
jgi:hypothetical protein